MAIARAILIYSLSLIGLSEYNVCSKDLNRFYINCLSISRINISNDGFLQGFPGEVVDR